MKLASHGDRNAQMKRLMHLFKWLLTRIFTIFSGYSSKQNKGVTKTKNSIVVPGKASNIFPLPQPWIKYFWLWYWGSGFSVRCHRSATSGGDSNPQHTGGISTICSWCRLAKMSGLAFKRYRAPRWHNGSEKRHLRWRHFSHTKQNSTCFIFHWPRSR